MTEECEAVILEVSTGCMVGELVTFGLDTGPMRKMFMPMKNETNSFKCQQQQQQQFSLLSRNLTKNHILPATKNGR